MISEINHDIILLQKTSEPATEKDLWVAKIYWKHCKHMKIGV